MCAYAIAAVAGKEFDARFTGRAGFLLAADGSFSTSFAIPVEVADGPWKVTLLCDRFIDDVRAQRASAYEIVMVAGGTAEPLAFSARPNAILPGHDVNFSGSGCRADGHPLGYVSVSLGP